MKRMKINKKRPGLAHLKKNSYEYFYLMGAGLKLKPVVRWRFD